MTTELASKRFAVDDLTQAMDLCFEKGWTDGLPVVPPTEARVQAMLDAAGLAPDKEIAFITNRQVGVTAEKVAINAVMAGCKPEYMPVVVAAVEGIADPRWGYHGPATSTGGAGVLMIVNGPIGRRLDFNSGDNLFGPGWRANATVGRALRLVMRNVIGTLPGLLDRGTLGHPGKYTYVIAENEAESPWTPLHVERGFSNEDSAVTVMAAEGPHQFYNQLSSTADGRPHHALRRHAHLRQHHEPAELRGGDRGRAHAGDRRRQVDQGGHPDVRVRAHPEQHRAPQAHRAHGGRDHGGGRGHAAADRRGARGHPRGRGGRARRRLLRVYPRLGQPPHQRGRDEAHQRQEGMMARLEILDPTVEARKQPLTYVARPDSLQGKRIGLVENTKFNSDRLLLKIGEILKQDYGAA